MKKMSFFTLLVGVILLSLLWQGGTFARLLSSTEPITNAFDVPECTITVLEEFDGSVKENVKIQVGGDVAQYLRVQMIATLQDEAGNTLATPIALSDFTIEGFEQSAWVYAGGYYYYKTPLQPDDVIAVFERACVNATVAAGQIPTLIIAAQGIQVNAAEAVWGVTIVDGVITGGGQNE